MTNLQLGHLFALEKLPLHIVAWEPGGPIGISWPQSHHFGLVGRMQLLSCNIIARPRQTTNRRSRFAWIFTSGNRHDSKNGGKKTQQATDKNAKQQQKKPLKYAEYHPGAVFPPDENSLKDSKYWLDVWIQQNGICKSEKVTFHLGSVKIL